MRRQNLIQANIKNIKNIENIENGAKYCDCPACAAAEDILRKKDSLLK
jgi:hypothetical protein